MSTKVKVVDDFADENQVKSLFVKFNKPGEDKIMGTLISIRRRESNMKGKEGEIETIYDIKADYGSYHELDEMKKVIDTPVVIEPNGIYSVSKDSLDTPMRFVKIGQKVGFKFIEEIAPKTKGFNPTKVVRVFTPKNEDGTYKFDQEFLDANAEATI